MLVLGLIQREQLLEFYDARPQGVQLLLEGGGVLVLGLIQGEQLLSSTTRALSVSSSCSRAVACSCSACRSASSSSSSGTRALSDSSSCSRGGPLLALGLIQGEQLLERGYALAILLQERLRLRERCVGRSQALLALVAVSRELRERRRLLFELALPLLEQPCATASLRSQPRELLLQVGRFSGDHRELPVPIGEFPASGGYDASSEPGS